jgi:hypothetical protein
MPNSFKIRGVQAFCYRYPLATPARGSGGESDRTRSSRQSCSGGANCNACSSNIGRFNPQ